MSEKDICLNFKSLALADENISVDPHITLAISIPIPHQLSTLIQNSDSSKTVYFNSWNQLFCANTPKSHFPPEACPKRLSASDQRHICSNVTRPDPACPALPNTNRYPPYSSFHLFVEDFESQQLVRLLVQPSDFPSTIIQLAHNIMNNSYRRDNEYLLLNGKI
uniref:Uncharacterized protein n=1 Tax=Ditylenchus dipsaci TaxID=166011 RepID=A0A915DVC1_9BILA